MAEINVTIDQPEAPPAQPTTTTQASENSSTALEVGRLMERVQTLETQVTEANSKAETAEQRAREAEATAESARRKAEEAQEIAHETPAETIVEEPAIVPVVLEEVPNAAPPAKKRGRIATLFLGNQ